jgi:predicted SAM-dependent methyltransferase
MNLQMHRTKKIIIQLLPSTLKQWIKKIRKTQVKHRASDKIKNYIKNNSVIKLHIGAGGNEINEWLNTDIEPQGNNIILLDASQIFPIPDESIDYIYSEHVFEHLTINQQIVMLEESYRTLKHGGKIRIATPDFNFIMSIFNNRSEQIQDYINWNANSFLKPLLNFFGTEIQTDVFVINNFFHDWGHKFIHNKSSLNLFLKKFNFQNITQYKVGQSDDANLLDLEKHGQVISEKFNEMETMIFEGTKR